jgi:hypothetical protein
MKITINTEDVAEVHPTPRGAGVEASFRVVRYKNLWQFNGRATHSVADTAALMIAVLHEMNEVDLATRE